MHPELQLLLSLLDEAYRTKSWHGPNLRGSIRGLTVAEATWRPAPKRHCIADLVAHAAYWKYAIHRQLTGGDRGSFPLKGSNWVSLPEPFDSRAWTTLVKLLNAEHRALRETIAGLDPDDLHRSPPTSKYTRAYLIRGVAVHDIYHAGQVQLLKRLARA